MIGRDFRLSILVCSGAVFLVSALWWGEAAPPLALMALAMAGMALSAILRMLDGNGKGPPPPPPKEPGPTDPGYTPDPRHWPGPDERTPGGSHEEQRHRPPDEGRGLTRP